MESPKNSSPPFKNRDKRHRINQNVIDFKRAHEETQSGRAAAKKTGQPRSTVQYHIKREAERGDDKEVSAFFRTVSGMALLHRLAMSIEFVLSQLSHAGLRLIQKIYELSGLDRWVACSQGTLSQRVRQLETNLIVYGEQQEARLLASRANKKAITCCLDETFPSGICLVGMEPVSNFILLEEMAAQRDVTTWAGALDNRLEQLQVNVIQVTSDEARALVKYTEQHLNAHHSPDLFHVQQDVSKASAAPLRAKIKKATSALEKAEAELSMLKEQQATHESQEQKPVGRPVDYAGRLASVKAVLEVADDELKIAEGRREHVREAEFVVALNLAAAFARGCCRCMLLATVFLLT